MTGSPCLAAARHLAPEGLIRPFRLWREPGRGFFWNSFPSRFPERELNRI